MDIEDEIYDRSCSRRYCLLYDETVQKISELIHKARTAPAKQNAMRYLDWAVSLVWRRRMNHPPKVDKFFLSQLEYSRLGVENKMVVVPQIINLKNSLEAVLAFIWLRINCFCFGFETVRLFLD